MVQIVEKIGGYNVKKTNNYNFDSLNSFIDWSDNEYEIR